MRGYCCISQGGTNIRPRGQRSQHRTTRQTYIDAARLHHFHTTVPLCSSVPGQDSPCDIAIARFGEPRGGSKRTSPKARSTRRAAPTLAVHYHHHHHPHEATCRPYTLCDIHLCGRLLQSLPLRKHSCFDSLTTAPRSPPMLHRSAA